LINIEIRDPFWRSPLTNQKIYFVNRSTWNPIWRFPFTEANIDVVLYLFIYLFFKVLLVIPESKPWFFAIINLMILSSSIILLDYIKDSSCNDSKIMQWFMIRCHACIRTWFWNIGPIIFF
jgi:hypothetical protein